MAGLSDWQWLYLLEGVPAIVLGFLVLKVMTDRPEEAAWLAAEERDWLVETLASERAGRKPHEESMRDALATLGNPRVLTLALIYLGTSAGLYTLGLWAPLLLKQYGFTALETGWLNALPSVVAVVAMIGWAQHSDRTLERTWHVVIPCVVACLGFVWAGSTHSAAGVLLALTVVSAGISAAKAPLWSMPSMFLTGASAAAGIAMINSIGNLGGFIGPFLIGWMKQRWGSYTGGLMAVGALLALSAAAMLALSAALARREPEQNAARLAGMDDPEG